MGNEERLADHLRCPILAGTATYGALLESPGRVRCTGVGTIALGPREGGTSVESERVGRAFTESGIETTVASDMPRRLWKKLAINAGINATTALARVENGALVDGPAAETAREAARETARVARQQGADLSDAQAADAVESVARTTAENTSSMHQDVLAERRTEVDAINGYVVDTAQTAVPVNETLVALLRAWENARDLR
jgi:2-dehydropantoate 2-reductase